MTATPRSARSHELDHCIESCQNCHRSCTETVQHCLAQGGEHGSAEHIRLLLDCAQICQVSADFMIRGSDLHGETCGICADICERCAEQCEAMGDDDVMRQCAAVCRECADACRRSAETGHSRSRHPAGSRAPAGH